MRIFFIGHIVPVLLNFFQRFGNLKGTFKINGSFRKTHTLDVLLQGIGKCKAISFQIGNVNIPPHPHRVYQGSIQVKDDRLYIR